MNNENKNVFGVDMGSNNQVNLPNNDPRINNNQSNNMYNQNVNNGQAYNQNMQQPYLQQNSNQPGLVINPVNNSINSNNTNMNTNINYQNNNVNNYISEDDFIDVYIGEKADKLKQQKFSICTFFFGVIYLYYRKMNKIASYWFAGNIIINIILNNFNNQSISNLIMILSFVANIVFAILFSKLYLKNVEKEIDKIKKTNYGKSDREILEICKTKGGTSKSALILGIVVYMIYAGLIVYSSINTAKNIINEDKNQDSYEQYEDSSYEEDTSIIDNKENKYTLTNIGGLYINITDDFKENPIDGINSHYKGNMNSEITVITVQNQDLERFSAEYIRVMNEKGFNFETMTDKTINNNLWKTSTCKYGYFDEYLYITSHNNNLYILELHTYNNDELIEMIEQELAFAD